MKRELILGLSVASSLSAADKFDAKVIDRQFHNRQYTYSVPGHSSSTATAECTPIGDNVSCTGTSQGTYYPPEQGQFSVTGATISLLLPDGKIAVLNCDTGIDKKTLWLGAIAAGLSQGKAMPRPGQALRDCHTPVTDDVTVEFKKNEADVTWTVFGKKKETEAYRLLRLFNK
jgi:hypothetical protein